MVTLNILKFFTSLNEDDFSIINTIEKLMLNQSRVKIEDITRETRFNESYVKNKIKKFNKINLIETQRLKEQYISVKLKFMGYDALALNYLVKKNILSSVGSSIGIGKESNVYNGILESNEECVIKFHKLGKTRFKSTRRKRDFFAEKQLPSKLFESALNAKREVIALKKLAGVIPVPVVYGYNRHIIVMQKIKGIEIYKCDFLTKEDFFNIFEELMSVIRIMINNGIIHGDLSVYNILISQDNGGYQIHLIDWPQFIRTDHVNAYDHLLTDLNNIYSFFVKKAKIKPVDIETLGLQLLGKI